MTEFSEELMGKWQRITNVVAKVMNVPTCLLMKTDFPDHAVLVANENPQSPYHAGMRYDLTPKIYCDRTIRSGKETVIPDARNIPEWADDPVTNDSMNFYIGQPVLGPDGRIFGTFCVLDRNENKTALEQRDILASFLHVIETDLQAHQSDDTPSFNEGELRAQLAQLQSSIRELTDADQRKNDFLTMLAHELRNPLAPVRSAAQTILAKTDIDPNILALAELIERQVGQMTRIVEGLLEVNDIVQENISLRPEPVELAEIIALAIETCEPRIARRNQVFKADLPTTPIILNADKTRLVQVFGNLLNNASKYTPNGGNISLTVKAKDAETVVIITDSGIGLRSEHLEYIFDLFKRVDNAPDRSIGGTGLGLTVSRKLVELHGGKISAKSRGLGKGSMFTVRLPAAPDMLKLVLKKAKPKPDLSSINKILIVDDNVDAADTLSTLLNVSKFETKAIYDGPSALTEAPKFKPDVILLDLSMPEMDGLETCRQIRAQSWGKHITIIALTGWGNADYQDQTQKAGFDHHIVKPVSLDDLLNGLAEATKQNGTNAIV